MSRSAEVTLKWGDADHQFRLGIGQLRELQEKCDAGPAEIFRRLTVGTWRIDDLREPIRLGLIGAGLEPVKALTLVERYVDARPLAENVPVSRAIIGIALLGAEDEPPGEADGEAGDRPTSPEEKSASPKSTEMARPSA